MRFTIAAVLLFSVSAVLCCKCRNDSGINDDAASEHCCLVTGGNFDPGRQDCPREEIDRDLAEFARCCRSNNRYSDCDCERGCLLEEPAPPFPISTPISSPIYPPK